MKNFLSILTLTASALLCGSLVPTQAFAQAAPQPAEVKKPAPVKKPVKPVAKAPVAKASVAKASALKVAAVAQPAWPGELASCKTEAGMNPVKREMCVWKYCKGNWGNGGCPQEARPGTGQSPN